MLSGSEDSIARVTVQSLILRAEYIQVFPRRLICLSRHIITKANLSL